MAGNILIIDDEEQLRKLLSRIIGLEGSKSKKRKKVFLNNY
jgi:DNA-binding NtrC family response regulator